MSKVFTGYKNCFLFIKRLRNGKYVIDSTDKAFIEYYVGDKPYNSYSEATQRIDEIKKIHNLARYDKKIAA